MRKRLLLLLLIAGSVVTLPAWRSGSVGTGAYRTSYLQRLESFREKQQRVLNLIERSSLASEGDVTAIKNGIRAARMEMKGMDFWMRYMEPLAYKKVNGPLPVEWETEVFEKFEKPYKREGAGLTLAWNYLEEPSPMRDSLRALVESSQNALAVYGADSITSQ